MVHFHVNAAWAKKSFWHWPRSRGFNNMYFLVISGPEQTLEWELEKNKKSILGCSKGIHKIYEKIVFYLFYDCTMFENHQYRQVTWIYSRCIATVCSHQTLQKFNLLTVRLNFSLALWTKWDFLSDIDALCCCMAALASLLSIILYAGKDLSLPLRLLSFSAGIS